MRAPCSKGVPGHLKAFLLWAVELKGFGGALFSVPRRLESLLFREEEIR